MKTTVRSVVCTLLISLLVLPVVFADDLNLLRKQATEGDAAAQYLLAVKYDSGQGVPRDYREALAWYSKSAEQGFAAAKNNIGVLYQLGQGVPRDFKEAIKWYRLAAQQGFALAQYNLGLMYAEGQGVKQDYVEARLWYQQAAEQGNTAARKKLGAIAAVTAEGSEKPAPPVPVVKATPPPVNKDTPAITKLPVAGVPKKTVGSAQAVPTPPQNISPTLPPPQHPIPQKRVIAAPEVKAAPIAAETSPSAPTVTESRAKPDDGSRVIPLSSANDSETRQAADKGSAEAQNKLGTVYLNGSGVPQDHQEARRWYLLAAAQGYAPAQNNLGFMYFNGDGITTNYAEALRWFLLAAEQGYALAQNNLGVMYQQGLGGVKQDYEKAFIWYRLAADQGLRGAQRNLGAMYFNGQGVEKNNGQAVKLLGIAAAQGDSAAAEILKTVIKNTPVDQGIAAQPHMSVPIP